VLAVGRLQDSLSLPALLPLLSDRIPNVRAEAAFALGQVGHKSAREALERALGDDDAFVKDNAAEALGKLGDKAATAKLLPLLRTGTPRAASASASRCGGSPTRAPWTRSSRASARRTRRRAGAWSTRSRSCRCPPASCPR
jgi:HEAT repeat protein